MRSSMASCQDAVAAIIDLRTDELPRAISKLIDADQHACTQEEHSFFWRHPSSVAMQQEYLQTIWREFDDSVHSIVPLFETEVRGVPMLQRLSDAMFAADNKAASGPHASVASSQQAGAMP